MKLKKTNEIAYFLAIILLAFGTLCCIKANFGMSMIAALSYCLKPFFGGFIGFAEYAIQAVLLVVFCLVMRRVRWQYLLSFVTALIYGGALNLLLLTIGDAVPQSMVLRVVLYVGGVLLVAIAVALFLKTYLPLEVYELFVKGLCGKYHFSVGPTKLIFDLSLLLLAAALAFVVHFAIGGLYREGFAGVLKTLELGGLGVGTVIAAAVTGPLVAVFGKLLDKISAFEPIFPKLKEFIGDGE